MYFLHWGKTFGRNGWPDCRLTGLTFGRPRHASSPYAYDFIDEALKGDLAHHGGNEVHLPIYEHAAGDAAATAAWDLTQTHIHRVGQNHTFIGIYGIYTEFYFWQGNHHTYGHIRCVYTVLTNPIYEHWCEAFPRGMCRVGRNHIYTVYMVFWQKFHQIYGHIGVYIPFWPTLHVQHAGTPGKTVIRNSPWGTST